MKRSIILALFSLFLCRYAYSQDCPENLGFELGNFTNWSAYYGFVSASGDKNVISKTYGDPIFNRHAIMSSKTERDYYGDFPVLAPNGSRYSVKLGNNGTGSNAEGLTYKIKIPENRTDFVLSYQYAVVFQDPNHPAAQQPRFNAKVLDVTTNQYIQCASFEYIATSGLPGFQKSAKDPGVLYKNWTTVALDLSGHQGKEVLLEFTTADCTPGGHFGYAYVDVNESCNGIVKGNEICRNATNVVLTGPAGYKDYIWYNENRSIRYGSGEEFSFNTVFPEGTRILLDLVPYDGFGCTNTINTVIIEKDFELNLIPEIKFCAYSKIDLFSNDIILNKDVLATYTAYLDDKLTKPVDPDKITQSGKYYIKGMSKNGCYDIKPINIIIKDYFADLKIAEEVKVCMRDFADLSAVQVIKQVPADAVISYYADKETTIPLSNPKVVGVGTYYIKLVKDECSYIAQVKVSNFEVPVLKVTDPKPFCANTLVNLNSAQYYAGSTAGLSLDFYTDNNMSIPLPNPDKISSTGKYYIRATDRNGCTATGSINIVIESPVLSATNPDEVCYPATIDIANKSLYRVNSSYNVVFSYYDSQNRLVADPKNVQISGTYKIVITNPYGCTDSKWINVKIHPLPVIKITNPKRTLEPYTVDITHSSVVHGSSEYVKIEYFEDMYLTTKVSHPDKIAKEGVYYLAFYNSFGCMKMGAVNVLIGKKPSVIAPTAFTPLASQNNKLYPFSISIKKLISFKVYNKWGNLVFETNSTKPEDGWNGYYKGKLQPFETYTWYAEAIDEIDESYKTTGKTILIL